MRILNIKCVNFIWKSPEVVKRMCLADHQLLKRSLTKGPATALKFVTMFCENHAFQLMTEHNRETQAGPFTGDMGVL